MAKAFKAKQINFMMPNRVGLLAEISAALAEAGVNIEALCAYEWEEKGAFMVIADNTAKAKRIISGMGAEDLETEDVIALEVPNRVRIPLIPPSDSEGIRHGVPIESAMQIRLIPPPPVGA
ncbi:MAG: ACT domain-containing protein [Syntrophales bacterium]|nr:ACT domain-containing protein [Syntrophales bacterium]